MFYPYLFLFYIYNIGKIVQKHFQKSLKKGADGANYKDGIFVGKVFYYQGGKFHLN